MTKIKWDIEIGENGFIVEFKASCRWENDGIGSYEYWGAKCYDKGVDYPVLDSDIEWDEKKHTPEQIAAITAYLSDNDNYTQVEESILNEYEENCRSYHPDI
jgi:hypothetical protein